MTSYSSVNVIGVPLATAVPVSRIEGTTTSIAPQTVNGTNQRQETPAITTLTAPALPTSLSQLPKQATTTNVPIVVQPLSGGACPLGYHLVSGSVCIKDITPIKITASPLSTTQITNATKSFSLPLHSANQPNTNPTNNDKNFADSNNEENFNTKILKSFNKEFE